MQMFITPNQPFSLTAVIRSHGWVQLLPFGTNDSYTTLFYVFRLPDSTVIDLSIQESGDRVAVQTDSELTAQQVDHVRQAVAWMLASDLDLSEFYFQASAEPRLAQAAARAQGRVLRSPTLFEDVVKTLFTTNTLWAATRKMNERLVQNYGDPLPGDPPRRSFPTAERLADVPVEQLKEILRIGYRAPYLAELARRVASGDLDLEALKTSTLPTPTLKKELRQIKGIGDYATSVILMILGRYDYLPIDSWAYKMVSKEFFGGAPVTAKDIEAVFARWGQWKGLAYWFWDWSA